MDSLAHAPANVPPSAQDDVEILSAALGELTALSSLIADVLSDGDWPLRHQVVSTLYNVGEQLQHLAERARKRITATP